MSRSRDRFRILYLIDDLTLGGAQRALLSQAAALDRERFEVHVASLELRPGGPLAQSFREAGIAVHTLTTVGEPLGLAPLRLRALVTSLRPDVVHTHLARAGIAGRIVARSRRVPHVVSTLHHLSDWTERRLHPMRILDRATLPLADRICAVSDAVRDAVASMSPALRERTVTLRNGVVLEDFQIPEGGRAAARARLGLAPADFVVGTVGRLEPSKGIETLLRAAAKASTRAPMLQLLIVGDGSDRWRLEELTRALQISSWVTFTGSRADVPRFLAAADLFACPSRSEGLGLAAIEALAAGLPVLASHAGGLPEIVEDRVSGRLLPPDAPEEWADAIAHAATHPESLEPWRRAAARRAHAFSIESSTAALERLYGTLETPEVGQRDAA